MFILRGIRKKWKQPIYFNFVNGATKKDDLVYIFCDQGTNNQSAIKKLVQETEKRYKRRGSQLLEFHFEVN